MLTIRQAISLSMAIIIAMLCMPAGHALAAGSKSHKQKGASQAVNDELAAVEKSIERIMQILSGQQKPLEKPLSTITANALAAKTTANGRQAKASEPADQATDELTKQRLAAAEKSLANVATALANKDDKPRSNCHWERVCVYITCCRWGAPPSDPGTVKCLDQCCGAYENKLVCN
jgi:hypothetical protein